MRIMTIKAQNYRTLSNMAIPFSQGYCTISGKNNAGKSCVIRLLLNLFIKNDLFPWRYEENNFDYKEDKTQWMKQVDSIKILYELQISRTDDPALVTFIEKITGRKIMSDPAKLIIKYKIDSSNDVKHVVEVNDVKADEQSALEIGKKLKEANLLFLYNSTLPKEEIYLGRGRRRFFYDYILSEDDKKQIDEAAKQTERKVKRLARKNREDLNNILNRLSEKFDVELSPLEGYASRRMPIGVSLKDGTVDVPLSFWGSGTQNRTQILMAILQANKIKITHSPEDKITPIVVIEEPESFLHPSAQSEFGKVLRELSEELEIQIIATTHSPYMLNREDPKSNILLCREYRREKPLHTKIVDTTGESWMAPFAEHLGIDQSEFKIWKPVFSSYKSRVLLVEGELDKKYFKFLQQGGLNLEALNSDIEIVPYGGKDTLKNNLLVKFVISNFDKVFITYDLDAESEIKKGLIGLGLKEKKDYTSIGINKPGKKAIEGLLPDRVLAAVNGRETDLIMGLSSQNGKERRKVKGELKKHYLEEFTKNNQYQEDELKNLNSIVCLINKRLK